MRPDQNNPNGSKRQRKWATKARTGCITCRRRRIKCDEGLPFCKRCVSTGRDCEGYSQATSDSSPPDILAAYHQPAASTAPAGVHASHHERSVFAMLHRECVTGLAGMFSRSFWTVDVMRATQVYPAIWHAGLAMAAMHRATCITAPTPQARESRQRHRAFSLAHFNTAVRAVLELTAKPSPLTDADKETVLLASTLFTCLSCLQEDYEQASKHATGGNRLYWKWQYWKHNDDDDEEDDDGLNCSTENHRIDKPVWRRPGCVVATSSLTAVFTHFETEFCNRFRTVEIPEARWRNNPHRCSAAPFRSAADAYTELQPLLAGICHNGRHIHYPGTADERARFARIGRAHAAEALVWKAKFDKLLARRASGAGAGAGDSGGASSGDEQHAIVGLRLLWMTIEPALRRDGDGDGDVGELRWDAYLPAMERLTTFAETFVGARTRGNGDGGTDGTAKQPRSERRSFLFSFSMTVAEALTFSGINCRDGAIRRRLIKLIDSGCCRDGLMDGRLLALILQTVMVFEENATTGTQAPHEGCACAPGVFICRDHRVCLINTEFLGERSAKIVLRTGGMLKDKLPSYETGVSW
ncbi:hypothetical protein PWT90_07858 [Aphanocladium album]|nr:hypothetical protein PWT90_07858 [Aphanocladium album]